MSQLALAAFIFVALHILPAISARETLIRKIGDPAYMGLFSLASFLSLAWMVYAYGQAPASEPLWVTGAAIRWATAVLMLLPFILLLCGTLSENPTSVLGKDALKSRKKWTNVFAITRHPVMWATAIWALLHLVNRPDATSALFFGSLAFLALAGSLQQEVRKRREFGKAWDNFANQTSFVPFAGIMSGKANLSIRDLGGWPVALSVLLWAAGLYFHDSLFGASALTF